ncbi:unnamed protein product [Arabis nemorensis]|uniref:Uncharacterized protein n=1 Tax=Arabis nemorensis TaxID=586526 RepID=A0A565AYP2_9BRAS|nr:unnamed protein product [Arabis nemorensis]
MLPGTLIETTKGLSFSDASGAKARRWSKGSPASDCGSPALLFRRLSALFDLLRPFFPLLRVPYEGKLEFSDRRIRIYKPPHPTDFLRLRLPPPRRYFGYHYSHTT